MENMKVRNCPICNLNYPVVLNSIHKDNFWYGRCTVCGHIYQISDYGDDFYNKHEYRTQHNYYKHSYDRALYISDFIGLDKKDKNKKLLDIGCGRGGVLYYLNDILGIKGDGVNPYPEESFIDEDINIIGKFVTDLPDDVKYDYIIMSHVLEHIPNLNETLTKIKKILAPFGILYIEVPDAFFVKQKLGFVYTPEHISYFHMESLHNVLAQNDFRIMKDKRSIKWANIKVVATTTNYGIFKPLTVKINYKLEYIKSCFKYYFGIMFNKLRGAND